ncbi:MAG: ABC transporter permease [Actinomycetota bacterium]
MSIAAAEAQELGLESQSGLWRDAFDRLKRNPSALIGFAFILLFLVSAVFAPLITSNGPGEQVGSLGSNGTPPSSENWFGLDEQGRDYFARVVYGARLSLLVGVVSVAIGLTIGLVLGSLAGYFGKWVDTAIMRTMDIMLAVPSFLLAIAIVSVLDRGVVQIMIAVGLIQVPIFARLLRSGIIAQRESDYVLAARSIGVPPRRMMMRHILPNSLSPVIVQGTLAVATAIIEVAALSFVGLGPREPGLPEWGLMLAEHASRLEAGAHLVFFPGMAIVLSVLGFNMIGDGLREALDPKLRS